MSTDSTFTPGPVSPATVADFAAYMIDSVAEGLSTAVVVGETEDFDGEGDFFALDQHVDSDGTLDRYPVTYAYDALLPLAERLTEQQAMALYHALKSQFGWSGTVFTNADVESAVNDDETAADLTDTQRALVVHAVLDSYEYTHLDDRFAERGNETIAEAVREAVEVVRQGQQ